MFLNAPRSNGSRFTGQNLHVRRYHIRLRLVQGWQASGGRRLGVGCSFRSLGAKFLDLVHHYVQVNVAVLTPVTTFLLFAHSTLVSFGVIVFVQLQTFVNDAVQISLSHVGGNFGGHVWGNDRTGQDLLARRSVGEAIQSCN